MTSSQIPLAVNQANVRRFPICTADGVRVGDISGVAARGVCTGIRRNLTHTSFMRTFAISYGDICSHLVTAGKYLNYQKREERRNVRFIYILL